jgi:hypothetical protein
LRWRSVADARVAPLAAVEDLDIFEERGSGLAPCGESGSVHELGFERAEEALHRGIVEAIPLTAHRDLDVVEPEQLAIVATGLLGGFKRWSQRLDEGGCDGQTKAGFRSVWAIPTFAAAVPKCNSSATASKYRS